MDFHLVVIVVLLGATCSLTQTPCCAPPQFAGVGRILTGSLHQGKGDNTEIDFEVQFDRVNKLVGTLNSVKDGSHTSSYKLILNYRKGIQYLIKGQECIKSPLAQEENIGCIPSNSSQVANYWYGSFGKYGEHMFAKTYQVSESGLTGFVSVTDPHCALVSEVVYGNVQGVPTMRSTVLVNQSEWINPDFFNLPKSCVLKDNLPLTAPWSSLSFLNW